MKTLLTGATGLLGRSLLPKLREPIVLTRNPESSKKALGQVEAHGWDPSTGLSPPAAVLEPVEAVIHLAGEPIAGGRWTAERKRRIESSRVAGTLRLVDLLKSAGALPKVFVCASAVGLYGDRGDEPLTEQSPPGSDWLSRVCVQWEEAAAKAAALGARVVCCRLGLVLAPGGGALAKMLPPFRMGVGGKLGTGKQWMPWVHIDDVVRVVLLALQNPQLEGALNLVSPNPVRNAEFTHALGEALGRPTLLPVPQFALNAALGEMATILLASQRAQPTRLLAADYEFAHPELRSALAAVLHPIQPLST